MIFSARTFFHENDGSSLLETAASLTALLMLIFGIMDCSRMLYIVAFVGYSAREGARYAMVRGSSFSGTPCSSVMSASCTATSANVTNLVRSTATSGISTGNPLVVTTTWPGTTAAGTACVVTNGANSPGCIVKVQVVYTANFLLPFLPTQALSLKSNSAVTIAQ